MKIVKTVKQCMTFINSTAVAVLLFCPLSALTLTKTARTVPEYHFEITERVFCKEGGAAVNYLAFGAGLTSRVSFEVVTPFILYNEKAPGSTTAVSDVAIDSKFLFYQNQSLLLGFQAGVLIPSSNNMHKSEEYHDLSRGVDQFSAALLLRYQLGLLFIHANLFYHLQAAEGEDFYGGFRIDPTKEESWKSLFGLNPLYDGSFLSLSRMENDWYHAAIAFNTEDLYPFVPAFEFYYASACRPDRVDSKINVDGVGVSPFKSSASFSYFFRSSFSVFAYAVVSAFVPDEYSSYEAGLGAWLQF